ncbi:aromatic-ring hydroxylase-like protein [Tanacetum coccineum]
MIGDYPNEIKEMIEKADANSLSVAHLRYRAQWDLLTDTFCKGNVTVAGDAMHVMAPFLGQGGSAGLEDAVVLARNMAQIGLDHNESGRKLTTKCVQEAFELYVKQRRMRFFLLSLQGYLIGQLLPV